MDDEAELESIKTRTGVLAGLYIVLFGGSLVVIVLQSQKFNFGFNGTILFAVLLGSAILTRLYRQSLVGRYNAILAAREGKKPPLT